MFITCRIWCLADVSSVSPSSEQTGRLTEQGLTRTGVLASLHEKKVSVRDVKGEKHMMVLTELVKVESTQH